MNGTGMFSSPQFKQLHVHTVRNMIFWNVAVMRNKTPLNNLKVWLAAAKRAHLAPLISFAGNGNLIPSTKTYTTAIRAFIRTGSFSVQTLTPRPTLRAF